MSYKSTAIEMLRASNGQMEFDQFIKLLCFKNPIQQSNLISQWKRDGAVSTFFKGLNKYVKLNNFTPKVDQPQIDIKQKVIGYSEYSGYSNDTLEKLQALGNKEPIRPVISKPVPQDSFDLIKTFMQSGESLLHGLSLKLQNVTNQIQNFNKPELGFDIEIIASEIKDQIEKLKQHQDSKFTLFQSELEFLRSEIKSLKDKPKTTKPEVNRLRIWIAGVLGMYQDALIREFKDVLDLRFIDQDSGNFAVDVSAARNGFKIIVMTDSVHHALSNTVKSRIEKSKIMYIGGSLTSLREALKTIAYVNYGSDCL